MGAAQPRGPLGPPLPSDGPRPTAQPAPTAGAAAGEAEGLPGMVAEVLSPRCDGCGACAEVCPVDAVSVSMLATIDAWQCTGCGRCVAACPREAIAIRKR